ncbi:hypothetical protein ES705_29762 [subsurface metagenome]
MKITKEITIEELVEIIPESVRYLMEKGRFFFSGPWSGFSLMNNGSWTCLH